jgi:hypothetical protein
MAQSICAIRQLRHRTIESPIPAHRKSSVNRSIINHQSQMDSEHIAQPEVPAA